MKQGTTPTHTFVLPFDTSTIAKLQILYAQGGEVLLTKGLNDCTLDEYSVSVKLKQEDSFLFNAAQYAQVQVQVRVLTTDGNALASDIMRVPVDRCLSREVL